MTPNKIPTDEEILRSWKEKAFPEPPEGSCWPAAYCTDEDMLEAIRQARAAGREEQREKQKPITWAAQRMLETIRCVGVHENNDVCGVTYICPNCRIIKELEEAIRAQGEEGGKTSTTPAFRRRGS